VTLSFIVQLWAETIQNLKACGVHRLSDAARLQKRPVEEICARK
jgi:hypothetical protein